MITLKAEWNMIKELRGCINLSEGGSYLKKPSNEVARIAVHSVNE